MKLPSCTRQQPLNQEGINALVITAVRFFGVLPPVAYLDVLRQSDGLSAPAFELYGSCSRVRPDCFGHPVIYLHGLVEANQNQRPDPEFDNAMLLARDQFCLYGIHVPSGTAYRWGASTTDREVAFETVEAMLLAAFASAEAQQGIQPDGLAFGESAG